MSRRTQERQFRARDRIAAFAEATEAYAETLEDPDLANVYWGKSLGLWQAVEMLAAGDRGPEALRRRGPSAMCGSRTTDRGPSATPRRAAAATPANGGARR
jgi:hypothetical protein